MQTSRGSAISIATSAALNMAVGIAHERWQPDFSTAKYTGFWLIGVKSSFNDNLLRHSDRFFICWQSEFKISNETDRSSSFLARTTHGKPQIPGSTVTHASLILSLSRFFLTFETIFLFCKAIIVCQLLFIDPEPHPVQRPSNEEIHRSCEAIA